MVLRPPQTPMAADAGILFQKFVVQVGHRTPGTRQEMVLPMDLQPIGCGAAPSEDCGEIIDSETCPDGSWALANEP